MGNNTRQELKVEIVWDAEREVFVATCERYPGNVAIGHTFTDAFSEWMSLMKISIESGFRLEPSH